MHERLTLPEGEEGLLSYGVLEHHGEDQDGAGCHMLNQVLLGLRRISSLVVKVDEEFQVVYLMSSSLLGNPLSIFTLLIFLVRKKSKVSCSMLDRLTPPGLFETIVTVLPSLESSTGSHITPCTYG